MDTNKLHSIKALLNCRATGSLVDRDFVCSRGMNTQTLSCNILVFNANGSPNETGQISKVVDVRGPLINDSRARITPLE